MPAAASLAEELVLPNSPCLLCPYMPCDFLEWSFPQLKLIWHTGWSGSLRMGKPVFKSLLIYKDHGVFLSNLPSHSSQDCWDDQMEEKVTVYIVVLLGGAPVSLSGFLC